MIGLLPNCGFLSETSRMLEIAGALRERGAAVALASQGGPYEYLLDASDMPWTRLPPGMDRNDAEDFREKIVNWGLTGEPLHSRAFMREAVSAEIELFREIDAEMAVIGFDLTAFLSSRVVGIPLATSHGGSYVPPVFERGLAPAPVNPPVTALSWLPDSVGRLLANQLPRRLKSPVDFLNRMADEVGVEPVPTVASAMCGDLTLVTEIPEVLGIPADELEAWHPTGGAYRSGTHLRYVGPLYAKLDVEVPSRVEAFLEEPGPVVQVAPTSVTKVFLEGLVDAVRRSGARTLVASTIHDVDHLEDEHTCVADVLPNHRVMPNVDLAVIMGGQGSVQCAMAAGTPIVGFPWHGEQELNLALAERQGVAVRLPPKVAHTDRLTATVERMLDDPAPRKNAERVRALYDGVDGASNAADAILDVVGASGSWRT